MTIKRTGITPNDYGYNTGRQTTNPYGYNTGTYMPPNTAAGHLDVHMGDTAEGKQRARAGRRKERKDTMRDEYGKLEARDRWWNGDEGGNEAGGDGGDGGSPYSYAAPAEQPAGGTGGVRYGGAGEHLNAGLELEDARESQRQKDIGTLGYDHRSGGGQPERQPRQYTEGPGGGGMAPKQMRDKPASQQQRDSDETASMVANLESGNDMEANRAWDVHTTHKKFMDDYYETAPKNADGTPQLDENGQPVEWGLGDGEGRRMTGGRGHEDANLDISDTGQYYMQSGEATVPESPFVRSERQPDGSMKWFVEPQGKSGTARGVQVQVFDKAEDVLQNHYAPFMVNRGIKSAHAELKAKRNKGKTIGGGPSRSQYSEEAMKAGLDYIKETGGGEAELDTFLNKYYKKEPGPGSSDPTMLSSKQIDPVDMAQKIIDNGLWEKAKEEGDNSSAMLDLKYHYPEVYERLKAIDSGAGAETRTEEEIRDGAGEPVRPPGGMTLEPIKKGSPADIDRQISELKSNQDMIQAGEHSPEMKQLITNKNRKKLKELEKAKGQATVKKRGEDMSKKASELNPLHDAVASVGNFIKDAVEFYKDRGYAETGGDGGLEDRPGNIKAMGDMMGHALFLASEDLSREGRRERSAENLADWKGGYKESKGRERTAKKLDAWTEKYLAKQAKKITKPDLEALASAKGKKEKNAVMQKIAKKLNLGEALASQKKKGGMEPMGGKEKAVLEKNKDKEFVKRLFDEKAPSIKNRDGSVSSHKMASGEIDGKHISYPTIVTVGGKLKELSPKDAMMYARMTGEFIEFKTAKEADSFGRNYKKGLPEKDDFEPFGPI